MPHWAQPMNDELLLRPGITAKAALDSLKPLIVQIQNVASSGGGNSSQMWNRYLLWVEAAESQLSSLFRRAGLWQGLYTDRYWHIRGFQTGPSARPHAIIANEATWQGRRLQAVVDQLERAHRDLSSLPDGALAVVPDTSFLMNHHEFFDELDWAGLLAVRAVRLVVPLAVIDELDDLSFRGKDTSVRARKVIRALRRLRGHRPPEEPVPVRPEVDLQILVDPPGHRRRPNSDDEILARAEYLAAFVGPERVRVAAFDYGIQLRAPGRDLSWIELPSPAVAE